MLSLSPAEAVAAKAVDRAPRTVCTDVQTLRRLTLGEGGMVGVSSGTPVAMLATMSKPVPPIFKYMTTSPHTIGAEQTITMASKLMADHKIRHLPVLHGGKVVGLLSRRDINMIETLKDVDPNVVTVEDAMSGNPYVTDAETLITEVCSTMAEHKYGSAIVTQANKVVGIFTTVDACRVLAELFETRLR